MTLETEKSVRCPHFQLRSEALGQEANAGYLTVRHCLLTTRMRRMLASVPEAEPLVLRLSIQTETLREYSIVGPDLDAVTHANCNGSRCDGSCTPAYMRNLEHFGVVDPNAHEVTCNDDKNFAEEGAPKIAVPAPPCPR